MRQHTITEPRRRGGIPRLRPQSSIALLSCGFRPFFLGAGLWATVAMVLWIGLVSGLWQFANAYGDVAWHAHEFLFGYVSAVLTGFLLTAIPNWTGRLPLQGSPLLALCLLWAAGRVAMLATDQIGVVAAAAVDCAYLPTLAAVILREIIVGRNWRNLKVTILVILVALANVVFQVEVLVRGAPDYGLRLGTAAIVGLIMLVGGRITPSFTHNWLTRAGSAKLPAPLDRFDMTAIAIARRRAPVVDRSARLARYRRSAHLRRGRPGGSPWALGRRADVARTDRAYSACRLRLRAVGRLGAGRRDPLAGDHRSDRSAACLDNGCDGHDDARRDDAGDARAHRAQRIRCVINERDLRGRPVRRLGARSGAPAARDVL